MKIVRRKYEELDVLKALHYLHGSAWKALEIWAKTLAVADGPDEFLRRFKKETISPLKLQRLHQVLMVPDEKMELKEVTMTTIRERYGDSDIGILLDLVDEMLSLLKQMEFINLADTRGERCPYCLFSEQPTSYKGDRHGRDCKLAAVIAKTERWSDSS